MALGNAQRALEGHAYVPSTSASCSTVTAESFDMSFSFSSHNVYT